MSDSHSPLHAKDLAIIESGVNIDGGERRHRLEAHSYYLHHFRSLSPHLATEEASSETTMRKPGSVFEFYGKKGDPVAQNSLRISRLEIGAPSHLSSTLLRVLVSAVYTDAAYRLLRRRETFDGKSAGFLQPRRSGKDLSEAHTVHHWSGLLNALANQLSLAWQKTTRQFASYIKPGHSCHSFHGTTQALNAPSPRHTYSDPPVKTASRPMLSA